MSRLSAWRLATAVVLLLLVAVVVWAVVMLSASSSPSTHAVPGSESTTGISPPSDVNRTCTADDTLTLAAWIGSVKPGNVVNLGTGCYEVDGTMYLRGLRNLIFENGTIRQIAPDDQILGYDGITGPAYCGSNKNFRNYSYTVQGKFAIPLFFEGGCDITLENMTIRGPNTSTTAGVPRLEQNTFITFAGTQQALVRNVKMHGPEGDFVDAQSLHEATGGVGYEYPAVDITVEHCKLSDSGRQGLSVILANRVNYSDNTITNVHASVFDIEVDATGGYQDDINISHNIIDGTFAYLLAAETGSSIERLAFVDNVIAYQMRVIMKPSLSSGNIEISGNTAKQADTSQDFKAAPIYIFGGHVDPSTTEIKNNAFPLDQGVITVPEGTVICGESGYGACPPQAPVKAPEIATPPSTASPDAE
jgi:hypothetical protein